MTAMLTAENITIDDADVRLAGETPRPRGATLVLRGADGAEIELPARIQRMLLAALASVAENGQASIGASRHRNFSRPIARSASQ